MGRPQTFNANNAARTARDVFWTHGYEGASLQELEHATGLNKSSIYNTFGSKKDCLMLQCRTTSTRSSAPHWPP